MGIYRDEMIRQLKFTHLAPSSQETYVQSATKFFAAHPDVSPAKMEERHLEDWLIGLRDGYAPGSIRISTNALRFFYSEVIARPEWTIFEKFKPGKQNVRRPCLTIPEVWRILNAIRTPHHTTKLL